MKKELVNGNFVEVYIAPPIGALYGERRFQVVFGSDVTQTDEGAAMITDITEMRRSK